MSKEEIQEEFRNKYLIDIPSGKEEKVKDYLRFLSQSRINRRKELFEIASFHESTQCREWANEYLKFYTLPEHKVDFLWMWVRNPVKSLNNIALDFVNTEEMTKRVSLRSATYVLLDLENKAQEIDPDFERLEFLIQKDPMLLAPIAERVAKIRQREFQRVVADRTLRTNEYNEVFSEIFEINENLGGLLRSIRTEDWSKSWQILKELSFACLIENLDSFKLSGWKPESKIEKETYEFISEYIGYDGWKSSVEILQETIVNKDLRYQGVNFEVSPRILNPSNLQQISSRLLEIERDSLEGLQKKILRVLHDGELILKALIPMNMEIELDLTGIFSILLPVKQFSAEEYNWIRTKTKLLLNSTNYNQRKVLRYFLALEKLAIEQSKKRFRITEIIDSNNEFSEGIETKEKIHNKNSLAIGFDFGNSNTSISFLDLSTLKTHHGRDFIKDLNDRSFKITEKGIHLPSLIHYRSGGKRIIGFEAEQYRSQNETFKLMKRSLRIGWSSGIKVEEKRIKAPEAAADFISEVVSRLDFDSNSIEKIGFTAPVDAPLTYQETIRKALKNAFKVSDRKLELFDEATASILGLKQKIDYNITTLIVDIGGGTTDTAVLKMYSDKPSSQIFSRESSDLGGSDIEAIAFEAIRDDLKLDVEKTSEFLSKFMEAKHSLVNQGSMKPILIASHSKEIEFTENDMNKWIVEQKLITRFEDLIHRTVRNATNSGSGKILQVILTGGGSKWKLFQKITKKNTTVNAYVHDSDNFAVSLGAARASAGFSLRTTNPNNISILSIKGGSLFSKIVIRKGIEIPSNVLEINFESEEKDVKEIELDLRRILSKIGGERFLLYGKDGIPYLNETEAYTLFEPLTNDPLLINNQQSIRLKIDNRGHLLIKEASSNEIADLGSVL